MHLNFCFLFVSFGRFGFGENVGAIFVATFEAENSNGDVKSGTAFVAFIHEVYFQELWLKYGNWQGCSSR